MSSTSQNKLAIIIPCYNEEKRLSKDELSHFYKLSYIDVFLSSDGSTDGTNDLVRDLSQKNENIHAIIYEENQGKASTIKRAYDEISSKNYNYYGYLDADFSTSATEFLEMYHFILNQAHQYSFIFGSRISTLSSNIKRSPKRHYIGRIIITLLNLKYNLGVYDSQCGAKIFNQNISKVAFQKDFKTKWIFDIEILLRLKENNLLKNGFEFPLKKWEDVGGSKLGVKESKNVITDFITLLKNY